MGKLFYFPCVDYYDEYEEYYSENDGFEDDYGNCEDQVKDGWVRGFIRKCLMFILVRL